MGWIGLGLYRALYVWRLLWRKVGDRWDGYERMGSFCDMKVVMAALSFPCSEEGGGRKKWGHKGKSAEFRSGLFCWRDVFVGGWVGGKRGTMGGEKGGLKERGLDLATSVAFGTCVKNGGGRMGCFIRSSIMDMGEGEY